MPAKGADVTTIEAPEREPFASEGSGRAGAAVSLRDVEKRFASRRGEVSALGGVTLTASPGEVLGIVGPSGCGKSTLLELLAGLSEPTAGEVSVGGRCEPEERLRRSALMPQDDLLLPWRSALDNAALPLELRGVRRRAARATATPVLERLGLASFARARPHELSGGMRQRIAFARTLLAAKPLLLLDEPFGSLDSITRADMQGWLARALDGEDSPTVALVTHDVEEALFLADRVAVLSARPGRVRDVIDVERPRAAPRRETVTSPAFVALKERALEALA
jgi:ABC-type nitrate/sulfonate/bicarbonate transport system ATPase subunit